MNDDKGVQKPLNAVQKPSKPVRKYKKKDKKITVRYVKVSLLIENYLTYSF